nr:cobyrinate a,c-diamide synthase [Clostridium sp. D33t1_170424_F3]
MQPRILLAAAVSGSGKTTVTCAILRALKNRGVRAAAFKCGPDYIDPMFHREVLEVPSTNLDLFLLQEQTVRSLLCENAQEAGIAILEGVMGYYDGIGMTDRTSSFHMACVTKSPVVLLVDARGAALSLLAQIEGFLRYRPDSRIAGVIFNRLSPAQYPALKERVEQDLGIASLGFLPKMLEAVLESRHLGLVTAEEIQGLQDKLDMLAFQAEQHIDLDGFLALARRAESLQYTPVEVPACTGELRIAVAKDKAFCFSYPDSLRLLQKMGAALCFFSPLRDEKLPEGCSGLLLCGGYPELFAQELEANICMRAQVKYAVRNGMPCIAECGGFLYLHESIEDETGVCREMAGVLPIKGKRTDRLQRFGYAVLTARENNLLCNKGETIPVHEFHYWDSTDSGASFRARKASNGTEWDCVFAGDTLYAGYPHLHFCSNPRMAISFLQRCQRYKEEQINDFR